MADAKKLSSMDASFLYLETPEMPMHVGSMAIFRLPENYNGNFFEDFKAMIASRLHIAPILKARLEKAPLDIDHPQRVAARLGIVPGGHHALSVGRQIEVDEVVGGADGPEAMTGAVWRAPHAARFVRLCNATLADNKTP